MFCDARRRVGDALMDHVEAVLACLHGVRLRFRRSGSCLKRAFPLGNGLWSVALPSLAQLLYSPQSIGNQRAIESSHPLNGYINTNQNTLSIHHSVFIST